MFRHLCLILVALVVVWLWRIVSGEFSYLVGGSILIAGYLIPLRRSG